MVSSAAVEEPIGDWDSGLPPSWQVQDLRTILAEGYAPAPPSVGRRTDGKCLLYPGKIHSVAAEPEAGKTWFALAIAKQEIAAGKNVMYIDYEDGPGSITARLLALGLERAKIPTHFHYLQPQEPVGGRGRLQDLVRSVDPTLVVIDGVTEAMTIESLDLMSNQDSAEFFHRLPNPIAACGPAVLLLDHEVKSHRDRGRFALGAQHKLAAVDVSFKLVSKVPFSKSGLGYSKLVVVKDRHGDVRSSVLDDDDAVAGLIVGPHGEGVTATITSDAFMQPRLDREDAIKAEIRRALRAHPDGLPTKDAVKRHIRRAAQAKTEALNAMIEAGEVTAKSPFRLIEEASADGGIQLLGPP